MPLDAAILSPLWAISSPLALRALDRGGTLAIAGIHLSDIPLLHYDTDLFEERRCAASPPTPAPDGEEFLALAARSDPTDGDPYPLSTGRRPLADLAFDRFTGAAVIDCGG